MNVETISLCRGDGQGYVRLSFSDLQDVSFADLVVTARAVVSGQVIPCDLYWLDAVENMWSSVSNRDAVIVFHCLTVRICLLILWIETMRERCTSLLKLIH